MAVIYLEPREFAQGTTYNELININDSNGDPLFLGDGELGLGSGDEFGDGEYYEALFQIREGTADSGASVLLELNDTDAVVLGDGSIQVLITADQTRSVVSATGKSVLYAELDLIKQPEEEVMTIRWKLKVDREYARPE